MIYAIGEIRKGRVPVIELVVLIALSIVLYSGFMTYLGAGAVAKKAQETQNMHKEVIRFVKGSFASCKKGGVDITGWGEDCKDNWNSETVVNHINNKLGYKNPFNPEYPVMIEVPQKYVKTTMDGQYENPIMKGMHTIGFIFITKSSIRYKEKNRKRVSNKGIREFFVELLEKGLAKEDGYDLKTLKQKE